jgi:hypothetical protein
MFEISNAFFSKVPLFGRELKLMEYYTIFERANNVIIIILKFIIFHRLLCVQEKPLRIKLRIWQT